MSKRFARLSVTYCIATYCKYRLNWASKKEVDERRGGRGGGGVLGEIKIGGGWG
jgi:hypothetical protein